MFALFDRHRPMPLAVMPAPAAGPLYGMFVPGTACDASGAPLGDAPEFSPAF